MKRLLLLIAIVLTSVDLTMAQDVYYSGHYYNGEGNSCAAVYKNGDMLYSIPGEGLFQLSSSDVLVDDGDVYWVNNCSFWQAGYAYADIMKNATTYLGSNSGEERHIFRLAKGEHLWAAGVMLDSKAVCWRDNDPNPYYDLHAATGSDYKSYCYDVAVSREGNVYNCGWQYDTEGGGPTPLLVVKGLIWENGQVLYNLPNLTALYALDVHNEDVYSVGWRKENDNYYISVWENDVLLYDLTNTGDEVNSSISMKWNIKIDAGDVYVSGILEETNGDKYAVVWKNQEPIMSLDGNNNTYYSLDVNSNGVYAGGHNDDGYGFVNHDGEMIYNTPGSGACFRMYGLFVDNSCQEEETRSLPFVETFENGETSWSCWTTLDVDGYNGYFSSYWDRSGLNDDGGFEPHSGNHCVKHNYNPESQEGWLISPRLFLQPKRDVTTLEFMSCERYANDLKYEGVWISTTGIVPSDFTEIWSATDDPDYTPSNSWKQVSINLNDYQGETVFIAFKYSGADGHNWFIDDINVWEYWESCTSFDTPYTESFEYGDEPGYCWYVLDDDHSGENKCWKFNEDFHCAYHPWGQWDGGFQTGWLFSPKVELASGINYELTFSSWNDSYGDDQHNSVWISVDASSSVPNPSDYTKIWEETEFNYNVIERHINLSQYAGHTIRIAFLYGGTYAHAWYIDNFHIDVATGPMEYNIIAYANNDEWGTVTGGGTYPEGTTCTLTATPEPGYVFDIWYQDGYDYSLDPTISFTVTENASFEAVFAEALYYISASPNNSLYGTVEGTGYYRFGDSCALIATPNSGYEFLKWTKDNVEVSTDEMYVFAVTEDAQYVAVFGEPSVTYYTITTAVTPAGAGTVEGGGTFAAGSTVYLGATANLGWAFEKWSDGNTDNPREITVNGNATYTAKFAQLSYTLTVNANPAAGGSVTGGGEYHYGDVAQLTATPNDGYTFLSWSDGLTIATRVVTVTGDATYTAYFNAAGATTFTVTVDANDPNLGTVTGGGVYPENSVIQISATPAPNARFLKWKDGNTDNPREVTVTSDLTFTAMFEAKPEYTITVVSDDPTMGTVNGGGTFIEGTEIQISATPLAGFYFTGWNDGNADNPRTIVVTENATFRALFSANAVITFNVTLICNPSEGTLIGDGTYTQGATATIAAIPFSGYEFDKWNDGNTDNPRQIIVNDNITLVAFFKQTGVNENTQLALTLFPNPAKESFRISGLDTECQVLIYNSLGMLVKSVNVNTNQEIQINDLAAGFYLIRCGSQTLRLIKE